MHGFEGKTCSASRTYQTSIDEFAIDGTDKPSAVEFPGHDARKKGDRSRNAHAEESRFIAMLPSGSGVGSMTTPGPVCANRKPPSGLHCWGTGDPPALMAR